MTSIAGGASTSMERTNVAHAARARSVVREFPLVQLMFVATTLVVVIFSSQLRWRLASSTPWQCDEIPLLVRSTGLCGYVSNEAEAQAFKPSYYTAYMGALRSLKVPKVYGSIHTTAGFWTNLTVHLFGANPLAGRLMPLLWSVAALGAAGYAVWLVSRSIVGACAGMWFVALSPHLSAYSAQARGYAEAVALTLLLLIVIELFRRRPDRWWGGLLMVGVALQLSLTVYSMWIYFVLPVTILTLALPLTIRDRASRKIAWTTAALAALAIVAFMGIYTIDRWTLLATQASLMGTPLRALDDLWTFLSDLGGHILPTPAWLAVVVIPGVFVLWRSATRWWLAAIGAGVMIPAMFAAVNGSAGFVRNFGYLVGPLAVLFGLGVAVVIRQAAIRARPAVVAAGVTLTLIAGSSYAYAGLRQRAPEILLPDWGAMVMSLDREPETIGPRWIAPCMANHWQINWYRAAGDDERFLEVETGRAIELVVGAQYDEHGQPIIFSEDPARSAISRFPLPAYLEAIPPGDVRYGIELRRFRAVRQQMNELDGVYSDAPVFVMFQAEQPITDETWGKFLTGASASKNGIITYYARHGQDGLLRTLLMPGSSVDKVKMGMRSELGLDPERVHWFSLTSLTQGRDAVSVTPAGSLRSKID